MIPIDLRMDALEIELYGRSVVTARNPIEASATMAEETIDLAILDYNMPMMNGYPLARRLRSSCPDLTIGLHSAATDIPRWEMNSVDAFISKPTTSSSSFRGRRTRAAGDRALSTGRPADRIVVPGA